ncbi:S10 family peptidase [Glycocaulis alkaliphilus]|nr:peptidase S10 [Glycocaulis alkaliphilus]GGB68498.1 carboxypeptidase [Glycocaulis alkaliphilus]
MGMTYRTARAIAFASLALAAISAAHAEPASFPVITHHEGVFNGEAVRYRALVEETVIPNADGNPAFSFVTTAYIGEDAGERSARPVVFLFNGGPTVPASWLHMGAFGPRRILPPARPADPVNDPGAMADNPHTVLDVADLVFIDPPGTGFSRILDETSTPEIQSVPGDARAASDFVIAWLQAHDRMDAPVFLIGESYGTIRAAAMTGLLHEQVNLEGVVLFGQALNMVETTQRARNALSYATNLSALAAIAAYHGQADMDGLTLEAFIDEAEAFAMHEYLLALVAGNTLDDDEARLIADRLERYTGISAAYYLANRLVISKPDFRRELLRDEGLILGVYDARYAGPAPEPGNPPSDPFGAVAAMVPVALQTHQREFLGLNRPFEEYSFRGPSSAGWDWGRTGGMTGGPFADYQHDIWIEQAMDANPRFRLMVGTGIYDTTTTIGPARYLAAQAGYPRERITLREYEGGHMAYTNEEALIAFTRDVRSFLTAH